MADERKPEDTCSKCTQNGGVKKRFVVGVTQRTYLTVEAGCDDEALAVAYDWGYGVRDELCVKSIVSVEDTHDVECDVVEG